MTHAPVPLPKTIEFADFIFHECDEMQNKDELDKKLLIGTRRASSFVAPVKPVEAVKGSSAKGSSARGSSKG